MSLPAWAHGALPPSFGGDRWLYLWTTFSLLVFVLLVLEWMHRFAWALIERPAPLRSGLTVARLMTMLLLVTMLVGAAPDLWLLLRWGDWSPADRVAWSAVDRRFDLATVWPFAGAWALSLTLADSVDRQLLTHAGEAVTRPGMREVRRAGAILAGSMAVAAVLAFAR